MGAMEAAETGSVGPWAVGAVPWGCKIPTSVDPPGFCVPGNHIQPEPVAQEPLEEERRAFEGTGQLPVDQLGSYELGGSDPVGPTAP